MVFVQGEKKGKNPPDRAESFESFPLLRIASQ